MKVRKWVTTATFLSFLLVLVTLALSSAPPIASAEGCRFVLGFKAVHDSIPDSVGDCLVNEHYNPANGDALQETTKGLMVWRKADNFTAFTDGYRSWVNGPFGIQQRLNTERFEWEKEVIQPQVEPTAVAPPPQTTSGSLGKILFTSNRDSWNDVFIMNADGSDQRRLTTKGHSYGGALSKDGTKLVYDSASNPDANSFEIYVMNSDGTDAKRLTGNNSQDVYPTWSPDGNRIAFFSNRGGDWSIWTMNQDGGDLNELVRGSNEPASPVAWSPNGTIAWVRTDLTIAAVNADGKGQRRLIGQYSAFPAWSPDGGKIAFSKYERAGGVFQIWVANADGSGAVMLTSRGQNFWPSWSPDGSRITFASYRDGNWEVYSMNSDGSNQVNLTKALGDDKDPHWSR